MLLRAYVEPVTLNMVRSDLVRPEQLPNLTPEFIKRRLLGRNWINLYSAEYVKTLDASIQAAHRGEVAPVVYGGNSTGENARVVATATQDGLVELCYELTADVEPITRERWHFTQLDRGRSVVRRELRTIHTSED